MEEGHLLVAWEDLVERGGLVVGWDLTVRIESTGNRLPVSRVGRYPNSLPWVTLERHTRSPMEAPCRRNEGAGSCAAARARQGLGEWVALTGRAGQAGGSGTRPSLPPVPHCMDIAFASCSLTHPPT